MQMLPTHAMLEVTDGLLQCLPAAALSNIAYVTLVPNEARHAAALKPVALHQMVRKIIRLGNYISKHTYVPCGLYVGFVLKRIVYFLSSTYHMNVNQTSRRRSRRHAALASTCRPSSSTGFDSLSASSSTLQQRGESVAC